MEDRKLDILQKLCYTEMVYDRIRKKLGLELANADLERFIYQLVAETPAECIEKIGKNYYLTHPGQKIRLTINSYTMRIITVDRINGIS